MINKKRSIIQLIKNHHLKPAQVLVLGYASTILVGAVLFMLPVSSHQGYLPFIDALFTATSAVCVTGLVVVDTGTYFTRFGQTVIMMLIFIGSLGFMTMATTVFILMGKKITLSERLVIKESFNQLNIQGMVLLTKRVFQMTIAIEIFGALLLSIRFVPELGWKDGLFYGLFHSVSAFGNAGFDLIGGFRSLTPYTGDLLVSGVIMCLFIIGGLGFTVLMDIFFNRRWSRLRLHSRLVLFLTGLLLALGTAVILALEAGNADTLGPLSPPGKLFAALFTAATPRTAGFNVIPTDKMAAASLVFVAGLMFIGASPASTGGGIKTTTFGTLVAAIYTTARGKEEINIMERRLDPVVVWKALSVAALAAALIFLDSIILMITESAGFLNVLFEVVSAFGTVGLSTGITTSLTPVGRVVIILTMFAGRVGLLTLLVSLAQRKEAASIHYPKDSVLIG